MVNNSINSLSSLAGLIAFPFYLALIFILGVLEPGLSPFTTPMSLLGGQAPLFCSLCWLSVCWVLSPSRSSSG